MPAQIRFGFSRSATIPYSGQGIAALLATQPDMNLVAEASNRREAVQQFCGLRPDITLMDLQMRDMHGIDAMIAIRGEFPEARIIVLTTYADDVQGALKVGSGLPAEDYVA